MEGTNMAYKPIEIDRTNLTLMGVSFPDLETLEGVAFGVGSNMFEGWQPTKEDIEIARDLALNKITIEQVLQKVKARKYDH
jgi:hypothetical protein